MEKKSEEIEKLLKQYEEIFKSGNGEYFGQRLIVISEPWIDFSKPFPQFSLFTEENSIQVENTLAIY